MRASSLGIFLGLVIPGIAVAQGFAGLGEGGEGFAVPDPAYQLDFPGDDGPHPDFRIEWWYITATLRDETGQDLGIQWTLFRNSLSPEGGTGWQSGQMWMGHAAVTTGDRHVWAEKLARGGTGQAGAKAPDFEAWIDDWIFAETATNSGHFMLSASGPGFSYALTLSDPIGRVVHGAQGYSVKSPDGQASHYFSRPFLRARGQVVLENKVHDVQGQAWLDREWSSQPLSGDQAGWDWVGLVLDDERRIMAARVRDAGQGFAFGSLILPDGQVKDLGSDDFDLSPVSDAVPPLAWRLSIPEQSIDIEIRALNPDAWTGQIYTYWEGPVKVTGSDPGRGYLEMTGYR